MNKFSAYDIIICFLSCASYVADVGTDIGLIIYFFITGYQVWAALTLVFVAIAMLMMQVFSFHWHITDKTMSWKTFIIHLLFLAPLHRYIKVLKLGQKFRRTCNPDDLKMAHAAINDICILRLFEVFLESAPMLTLQLYIIFTDTTQFGVLIGFSTCFSLLSIAWSLTAYTDALHIAYEKFYKRTALSILAQTLWQIGMVTSRVFAIVLFATVFQSIVLVPLGIHLILMIVWITIIKPDFGTTACERHLFTLVSAIIHIFCFLNLKDGRSRWRMLVYYLVILIENSVLILIWFVYKHIGAPPWLVPLGFSVVFGGFLFGVLVMLLYYGCCHPSGPAPIPARKPEFHKPPAFVDQSLKTRMQVFDESARSARINLWLSASLDLSKEGLCENPVDDLPGYTSLHEAGNCGDTGDHSYSQMLRTPADVHNSEQRMTGLEKSPDSTTDLIGQQPLHALYLETLCHSPRSKMNKSENRMDYSYKTDSSLQDYTRNNDSASQDTYGVNDSSNNKQIRLNSSQSAEDFSQRGHNFDISQLRSDSDTNHSVPDNRLVEMFARCKLDPCYVSNSSTNDSVFHISPVYSPVGEDSSRGTVLSSVNSESKNTDTSRSKMFDERTPVRKSQEFTPTNISPLDPYKLWEESQNRMGISPGIAQLFYQPSPDCQVSDRISDSGMMTTLPDQSQGLSHLSMSYTAIDNELSSSHEGLRRNQSLTYHAGSVLFCKDQNVSGGSVYLNHSQLSKSDEINFSNLSLPLPDSSYNQNRSQRSLLHSSQGHTSRNFSNSSHGSTPHRRQEKDRSLSSYRDDSSPVDRHSSYSSDKGLSLSDRALTSGSDSYERSQRSFTSSGFQSEESNLSSGSPTYVNQNSMNNHFHSAPLVENEIMSIRMADVGGSEDVHQSVYDDSKVYSTHCLSADNSVVEDKRPTTNHLPSSLPSSQGPIEMLMLPPLKSRRSSAGLSTSGRFFKDPTLSDESGASSSEESQYPWSTDSSLRRSQFNEKSSLSAMISDMSSSKCGDFQSSDESLSLRSDKTLSSSSGNRSNIELNKGRIKGENKPNPTPVYENIENYPQSETAVSPYFQELKSDTLFTKDLLERQTTEKSKEQVNPGKAKNPSKGSKFDTDFPIQKKEQQGKKHSDQPVEEYDKSSSRLGHGVDLFNRDRWRASLDKEMRDRLVSDLDKLAPRKLYQLQSKTAKKNIAPVELTEYSESPYKFRKPTEAVDIAHKTANVLSEKFNNSYNRDYENIKNVNKQNGDKNESPNYLNQLPDYENVFNSKELLCPVARPESLTDSVSSGRYSTDNFRSNVCSPLYSSLGAGHVRAELCLESISDTASMSSRSDELSRTRSSINTSGINSAFKPVKSRNKSCDSLASKTESNKTFTVFDQNVREQSTSNTKDMSNSSFNKSSSVNKSLEKSRRRSDTSQFRDISGSSFDQSSFTKNTADRSRRRSDISQHSYAKENNNSTFPYSSDDSSMYSKSSQSFNYLNLVGYPHNYTSLNIAADNFSKNQTHSYSDSIPWEDSVNKSFSFHNHSNLSFATNTGRQPLKGLENTPTFSPIYGQDLRRTSLELSARKRFMSTPKLSSGSDMSLSRVSDESSSLSRSKSKVLSASTKVFDTTNQENTSTWSTQDSYGEHSSLSKTTYI